MKNFEKSEFSKPKEPQKEQLGSQKEARSEKGEEKVPFLKDELFKEVEKFTQPHRRFPEWYPEFITEQFWESTKGFLEMPPEKKELWREELEKLKNEGIPLTKDQLHNFFKKCLEVKPKDQQQMEKILSEVLGEEVVGEKKEELEFFSPFPWDALTEGIDVSKITDWEKFWKEADPKKVLARVKGTRKGKKLAKKFLAEFLPSYFEECAKRKIDNKEKAKALFSEMIEGKKFIIDKEEGKFKKVFKRAGWVFLILSSVALLNIYFLLKIVEHIVKPKNLEEKIADPLGALKKLGSEINKLFDFEIFPEEKRKS